MRGHHVQNAIITRAPPNSELNKRGVLGKSATKFVALLIEPGLVLPILLRSLAVIPFELATTDGSTVAVLTVFVNAVVAKVTADGSCVAVDSVRKTRANPGALTGTLQALAV